MFLLIARREQQQDLNIDTEALHESLLSKFPNFHDTGDMSPSEKAVITSWCALSYDPTEKEYEESRGNLIKISDHPRMAKSVKTVIANVWKYYENGFHLHQKQLIEGNNNFNYVDIHQVIHLWICDEVVFGIIQNCYKEHTFEHLTHIDEAVHERKNLANKRYTGIYFQNI